MKKDKFKRECPYTKKNLDWIKKKGFEWWIIHYPDKKYIGYYKR